MMCAASPPHEEFRVSPTLLELALILTLLVIAWQLAIAIAPAVLRTLRAARRDLDAATDAARDEEHDPPTDLHTR